MRRAHWWVGTATLATFLLTGAYMRWVHNPPVPELGDTARAVFRSRHLFLMLGALANLALVRSTPTTRVDRVISALVLIAPVFLFIGFVIEPEQPFLETGLYALFGAAALLAVRSFRRD